MIKGFIFDLDGVLVDTPNLHFEAWCKAAKSINIDLHKSQYEKLKGLSREASLLHILDYGNASLSNRDFQALMTKKNDWYLEMISSMTSGDILSGARKFLDVSKDLKLKIALGSASQNARKILDLVNLSQYFDTIIDGTQTSKSKPDPQVFQFGASELNLQPQSIVVFEDSIAGVKAANDGGFKSIGIGNKATLVKANRVYPSLSEVSPSEVIGNFTH